MVVRIVTYEAASLEEVEAWAREHADLAEKVEGLEEVTFLRTQHPPRAGALLVFRSADALARFQTTGRWDELRHSVQERWADDSRPAYDEAYRVVEVRDDRSA